MLENKPRWQKALLILTVGLSIPIVSLISASSLTSEEYCANTQQTTPFRMAAVLLLFISPVIIFSGFYILFFSIKHAWLRGVLAFLIAFIITVVWLLIAWIIAVDKCGIMTGGF